MMKEILFCRANFRNDNNDRRVILYLNDCCCGRKYCQENASCLVKNHLKKVSLRDAAIELSIEKAMRQLNQHLEENQLTKLSVGIDSTDGNGAKKRFPDLRGETNRKSIEALVKSTGKETFQWGLAAGVFSGLTYGLNEASGYHDWLYMCNSA
ncbi:uncharacterized protein LOC110709311 [Chenopodium quinoa]|uniref:uncharacterized protein LOC110709311 n=1 Tax=Chenopodium quinoa TaxID=63459 RepID=UPI000B76FC1A|nr:uncharacterized protein LOC110709311 [Chenopodium quinoa]